MLLTVVVAAFVCGLALASCGGDDSEATETTVETTTSETTTTETTTTETTTEPEVEQPTVVRVSVVGGVPEDGIVRASVSKGDRVRIVVTSDVADEIHVHGYDLSKDVAAGGTARIAFTADIAGRFEVELEERGIQIADLTVNP
jgi:ABC-type glycerol-3-phosphate transport system substrate-binding protein